MQETDKLPTIGPSINISKLPAGQEQEYFVDKEVEWVKEMLMELNEKATDRTPEMYLMKSFMDIDLKIKKKFKGSLGEFVLVRGKLKVEFMTSCVRTLREMKDYLDLDFKACFIDAVHENKPEYEEVIEIFEDNDLFDLYFYENRTVDLKKAIHEQIYLNINEYPVADPDAPLIFDIDPKMPKN